MASQSYFGLDSEDGKSWTLVQRAEGRTVLLQRFKDTVEELDALAEFIRTRCERPRIYVKSTSRSVLRILKHICGIPDVEVMLVSEAGFRQYQAWLPSLGSTFRFRNGFDAQVLAHCAERMI